MKYVIDGQSRNTSSFKPGIDFGKDTRARDVQPLNANLSTVQVPSGISIAVSAEQYSKADSPIRAIFEPAANVTSVRYRHPLSA